MATPRSDGCARIRHKRATRNRAWPHRPGQWLPFSLAQKESLKCVMRWSMGCFLSPLHLGAMWHPRSCMPGHPQNVTGSCVRYEPLVTVTLLICDDKPNRNSNGEISIFGPLPVLFTKCNSEGSGRVGPVPSALTRQAPTGDASQGPGPNPPGLEGGVCTG